MVSGGRKLQSADRQMSEAFITSVFLAMSGGFQDAYTYFTRDEVFSNAQTGNVVLMSQNFMTGQWGDGLRYLFPVLAFAIGVVAAERIQSTFKYAKKLHWRQMILLIEILILFVVGFMPGELDMLATVLVSFSCSHAGTDLPEGGRLFLCKHYVHRKFTKRHGGVVRVLS